MVYCIYGLQDLGAILMLFFGSSAYALGTPSFSINGGDNEKGTLSMEELYIGGIKTHEDVKIEFDFKNSTFRLLTITEADNSIPVEPIENITAEGIKIGLKGCLVEARAVTCYLSLISVEFDRTIVFCGNTGIYLCDSKSTVFDNRGNQYFPTKVAIANGEDSQYVEQMLVADVETQATIVFENFSTQATDLSLLELSFDIRGVSDDDINVKFRNISF